MTNKTTEALKSIRAILAEPDDEETISKIREVLAECRPAPVSAKREWVDLTPIELAEAFSDKGSADAGIRAVIAAFKEKNK